MSRAPKLHTEDLPTVSRENAGEFTPTPIGSFVLMPDGTAFSDFVGQFTSITQRWVALDETELNVIIDAIALCRTEGTVNYIDSNNRTFTIVVSTINFNYTSYADVDHNIYYDATLSMSSTVT